MLTNINTKKNVDSDKTLYQKFHRNCLPYICKYQRALLPSEQSDFVMLTIKLRRNQ